MLKTELQTQETQKQLVENFKIEHKLSLEK